MVVALAAAASSRMRSLSSAQPSFLCHTDNHCADFEASAPLAVPIAVERDGLGLETKEACDQAHRAASQWRAASGRLRRCRPQSVPSVAWCFPGWNRHWRYRFRPNATESAFGPKKPVIKLTELRHDCATRADASDAAGRNRFRKLGLGKIEGFTETLTT